MIPSPLYINTKQLTSVSCPPCAAPFSTLIDLLIANLCKPILSSLSITQSHNTPHHINCCFIVSLCFVWRWLISTSLSLQIKLDSNFIGHKQKVIIPTNKHTPCQPQYLQHHQHHQNQRMRMKYYQSIDKCKVKCRG